MTEEEIEVGAASDPDLLTQEDLKRARVVRAGSAKKPVIWVHVDEDVR